VRLDRRLGAEGLQSRLILQVHDEVLVEAPPSEHEQVEAIILDALINAASLSVPLEISLHWGENWAAAKG
jgi:DNA polymerase-1